MMSAVVAELRQAIEDTVHGNLDKSNSKLFGMGYTSRLDGISGLTESECADAESAGAVLLDSPYDIGVGRCAL